MDKHDMINEMNTLKMENAAFRALAARAEDVEGMAKELRNHVYGAYGYSTHQDAYRRIAAAVSRWLKEG